MVSKFSSVVGFGSHMAEYASVNGKQLSCTHPI